MKTTDMEAQVTNFTPWGVLIHSVLSLPMHVCAYLLPRTLMKLLDFTLYISSIIAIVKNLLVLKN
jgi:hypothetical protein